MNGVEITAVPGPRWTRKRLLEMLIDCYGPSARGPLDINSVAAHVGVASTTVRRWIVPTGHRKPHVPKARIAQLQRGSALTERRGDQHYEYALAAIDAISSGEFLAAWTEKKWLDEHLVLVVEIHGKPWHQVVISKGEPRSMAELKRRATILNSLHVPTWFHAQVLAHRVMQRQQNWRVHPAKSQLAEGRTRVWMADAPPVDLDGLAIEKPT